MFCLRILVIMRQKPQIYIRFFFQKRVTLLRRNLLKLFLARKLKEVGKKQSGELRIILCSDEELLQINRNYLQHDYYTDIITFPFTDSGDSHLDAELYISVDRVRDNAKTQKSSFSTELHRVIFHGVLHLCGYGDKTEAETKMMRGLEDSFLTEYFECST